MLQREILIRKRLGPVDTSAASAITKNKVATLDHEVFDLTLTCRLVHDCSSAPGDERNSWRHITYHSMKFAALVTLR